VVECDLAKVEVAGSNPVSRSKISAKAAKAAPSYSLAKFAGWTFFNPLAYIECPGRGTQVVRERSAKPLYVSSILTRASKSALMPRRSKLYLLNARDIVHRRFERYMAQSNNVSP